MNRKRFLCRIQRFLRQTPVFEEDQIDMKNFVLGIDVGGTNVKLGVVDNQGKIITRRNLVTGEHVHSKAQLIQAFIDGINTLMMQHRLSPKDFSGIGIGLPGLVDPIKGVVLFLPNIPGWKNVPLKKILEQAVKIPVFIENDVNLIAMGEWKFGAGKGSRNMICMTLGTGVGGGLILNNELYRGEGFAAGEIGHIPLNEEGPACNCGGFACFEGAVGNRQLTEKTKKTFGIELSPQQIGDLAGQNDPRAIKFWEETGVRIGNGLTGVVNLLNPPLIVIGGGVSNNYAFLAKTIKATIKRRAMKVQAAMVKIVRAKLGDDAGILGAQVLVQGEIKRFRNQK